MRETSLAEVLIHQRHLVNSEVIEPDIERAAMRAHDRVLAAASAIAEEDASRLDPIIDAVMTLTRRPS